MHVPPTNIDESVRKSNFFDMILYFSFLDQSKNDLRLIVSVFEKAGTYGIKQMSYTSFARGTKIAWNKPLDTRTLARVDKWYLRIEDPSYDSRNYDIDAFECFI